MSDEELTEWAAKFDIPTSGERDGSEPIEAPPAGVASTRERRARAVLCSSKAQPRGITQTRYVLSGAPRRRKMRTRRVRASSGGSGVLR
jgi:hypothetical protein